MVGRRRKSSQRLAASPQRSWLWGRHAVLEMLAAGRWRPLEVRLAEGLDEETRAAVATQCALLEATVTEHPAEQLTRWCATGEHQGLLAQMPPYPYATLDAAIDSAAAVPLYLIVDRIQDPHNFGAILRSAEVFGVDAVFVGETSQCEVTPHVARSSAGAVNHLTICRSASLAELPPLLLSRRSVRTWAASGSGDADDADAVHLAGPVCLVIGNEGRGIAAELAAACSGAVRIRQEGRIGSLNAAVAAGILLYEVSRQRRLAVGQVS